MGLLDGRRSPAQARRSCGAFAPVRALGASRCTVTGRPLASATLAFGLVVLGSDATPASAQERPTAEEVAASVEAWHRERPILRARFAQHYWSRFHRRS